MKHKIDNINATTTINDLADIVKHLDSSMTIRIYDDFEQVIGAIRLVHMEEIQQIEALRKYRQGAPQALH